MIRLIAREHRLVAATLALGSLFAADASAQDVAIEDVLVTQAMTTSSMTLIGNNVTMIRVFVDTPGTNAAVPNVDAIIRVFLDGNEADYSPLRSINGPITSPENPTPESPDAHLDFLFKPPGLATDVDLRVILNPTLTVPGDDLDNNIVEVNDLYFRCRVESDIAYVPINYVPSGLTPDEGLMEPGIGDAFVRGIYKPGRWNYHRSPTGPLLWWSDINDSNNILLNTLRDIRVSQIPSDGYPVPDFVYGWLPGNPFNGNGQAIDVPGDAGFGNTQESRFQRTFAHEIGHLLGFWHNTTVEDDLCVDVEHHLANPLDVPRIRASALDVMYAAQVTEVAWVGNAIYSQALNEPRFLCDGLPNDEENGPDGEEADQEDATLRISGVVNHENGTVELAPVMTFPDTHPDPGTDDGTVHVILLDDRGRRLHQVRTAAGHTRACCADPNHFRPTSPLHVLVPAEPRGRTVARIEVRDAADGRLMAAIDRTPAAPIVQGFGPAAIDAAAEPAPFRPGMRIEDPIRVAWSVDDADGDEITAALFYSPDGEAWLPFRADITDGGFDLDPHQMPRSSHGRLRLIVSDGLNASIVESPTMSFLGSTQPEVYIITPNQFDTTVFGGDVVLHGYAWDHEQGTIASEIQWVSSLDGPIGTGRLFTVDDLSVGLHLLTAIITDNDGNIAVAAKSITITERQLPPPDPDGSGSLGIGDLLMLLTNFGPCGDFCPGDLNFDGQVDIQDLLILLAGWPG